MTRRRTTAGYRSEAGDKGKVGDCDLARLDVYCLQSCGGFQNVFREFEPPECMNLCKEGRYHDRGMSLETTVKSGGAKASFESRQRARACQM